MAAFIGDSLKSSRTLKTERNSDGTGLAATDRLHAGQLPNLEACSAFLRKLAGRSR